MPHTTSFSMVPLLEVVLTGATHGLSVHYTYAARGSLRYLGVCADSCFLSSASSCR